MRHPVDAGGRWALYDDKFILSGKGGFNAKSPQTWLQWARDYLAGRTDELDAVLHWAEAQTEQIPAEPDSGLGQFPRSGAYPLLRSCRASCGPSSAR